MSVGARQKRAGVFLASLARQCDQAMRDGTLNGYALVALSPTDDPDGSLPVLTSSEPPEELERLFAHLQETVSRKSFETERVTTLAVDARTGAAHDLSRAPKGGGN